MSVIITAWRPNLRKCVFQDRPDYVPIEVYNEAMTHKRQYNAEWEYWVWNVSQQYNCSQAVAEDACIRGIKKEFAKMCFIWGDKIGKWFEDFMEMGDIFNKVKHPEYLPELGYGTGAKPIGAENE